MVIKLLVLFAFVSNSYQHCVQMQEFLAELQRFASVVVLNASVADETANCLQVLLKTTPSFVLDKFGLEKLSDSPNFDLFLVLSFKTGTWSEALDCLDHSNVWGGKHKTIFIGDFSRENVKEYSGIALKRHWAVNLIFIDFRNFSDVMRYNPFSKQMLTGTPSQIISKDISGNLFGYELKIGMFENIVARWNGKSFGGRDGLALTETIKSLNATPKYIFEEEGNYGDLVNGTPTGLLKIVGDRTVDLSFNVRFVIDEYSKIIDYTSQVELNAVIVVLPIKSAKITNIINIIPPTFLTLASTLLILFSIYVKQLTNRQTLSNLFLLNMELLTNRTVTVLNLKYYKLVLIVLILYFFFVTNLFQARLVSVLTIPAEAPRLTKISQAADSDVIFNTDAILSFSLDHMQGIYKHQTAKMLERNKYFHNNSEYIERIFQCCPNEGFISLINLAKDYIGRTLDSNGYRKRCYYFLDEKLFFIYNGYILSHFSPLLAKVDRVIQGLHASGLLEYWEKIQRPVSVEEIMNFKKIHLRNLLFCFYILGGGWVLGLLVFLKEIGVYGKGFRRVKKRSVSF